MTHWLSHFLGLDNGSGPFYLWWSGFGANFGEITLITTALVWAKHHNCHTRGCYRLGHPHDGQVWCRRHHPKGSPR